MDPLIDSFNDIVETLPQAPLYNVKRLNDRINQFIEILIKVGGADNLIEELEGFADKLIPFVTARDGDYVTAKTYVDRGVKYLYTSEFRYITKALAYFHKAKDLWLQAATIEGHILALLNIGQLYLALKMNLAAKYYILSAAWLSINNNPEKFAKKISSSFALLVHCDFTQGAWISALASFRHYFTARNEFDPTPIDADDQTLIRTFSEVGYILYLSPVISNQLSEFIEQQKVRLGDVYNDFISHSVAIIDEKLQAESWQEFLTRTLADSPINDIGPTRHIAFRVYGSKWNIHFENTWMLNSLGEEFVATLQIFLVELSYSNIDLHFIKTEVDIEVVESAEHREPEQLASNHKFKWRVFCVATNAIGIDALRPQIAHSLLAVKYVLDGISMLGSRRTLELMMALFQNDALAKKTMTINLYQKIYRGLFDERIFNLYNRINLPIANFEVAPVESEMLRWNDSTSPLYSKRESMIRIWNRVRNARRDIGLALAFLKTQPQYSTFIEGLRVAGWLDWQILLSMMNHIFNNRAHRLLKDKQFASEEEHIEAFQQAIRDVMQMDEKDTFTQFPIEYFTDEQYHFDLQLAQLPHLVLQSWGLENKVQFPNFDAIKELLTYRFNFDFDDMPDISPL